MNVVDSSGWLEYFADAPNAKFFAKPIPSFSPLPAFIAPLSGPRMRISRASKARAVSQKPGADLGRAHGFRAVRGIHPGGLPQDGRAFRISIRPEQSKEVPPVKEQA